MNKAVFLDRDGVINSPVIIDNKPYPPNSLTDLVIISGVKEGIEKIKKNGFYVFVVTNQPDVARGKTPKQKVDEIHNFLVEELSIDEIVCCFHDDKDKCHCRKPNAGMILDLAEKWKISLNHSYLIGDRWRDIEAGRKAAVITILIDYQYDERRIEPDFTCNNFEEAVDNILKNYNQIKR